MHFLNFTVKVSVEKHLSSITSCCSHSLDSIVCHAVFMSNTCRPIIGRHEEKFFNQSPTRSHDFSSLTGQSESGWFGGGGRVSFLLLFEQGHIFRKSEISVFSLPYLPSLYGLKSLFRTFNYLLSRPLLHTIFPLIFKQFIVRESSMETGIDTSRH